MSEFVTQIFINRLLPKYQKLLKKIYQIQINTIEQAVNFLDEEFCNLDWRQSAAVAHTVDAVDDDSDSDGKYSQVAGFGQQVAALWERNKAENGALQQITGDLSQLKELYLEQEQRNKDNETGSHGDDRGWYQSGYGELGRYFTSFPRGRGGYHMVAQDQYF